MKKERKMKKKGGGGKWRKKERKKCSPGSESQLTAWETMWPYFLRIFFFKLKKFEFLFFFNTKVCIFRIFLKADTWRIMFAKSHQIISVVLPST